MQLDLPLFDRQNGADVAAVAAPPSAPGVTVPTIDPPPTQDRIDFVRTPRARRYILRIRPDGSLRVTVPRWGSKREARDFVARQERWIARERQRVLQEHGSRQWQHGTESLWRGERVLRSVSAGAGGLMVSYGDRRVLARDEAEVRAVVE